MRILKFSLGHIVLLTQEEQERVPAADEIVKLKQSGKVVFIISGNEAAAEVLSKLLKTVG